MSAENWIRDLPARVRSAIEAKMVPIDIRTGESFRRAGDAPDGMFQVASGYLRLEGLHSDGSQVLILVYQPGNTFGETPMIAQRPYNHSTVALMDTRVNKVSLQDFWELYRTHTEIPEALCRKFAHNISKGFVRREMHSTLKLKARIGRMLANIAEYCGEPDGKDGVSLSLPITHTDIAEHLDVTRQAVQREMGALRDAGILLKQDGRWRIRDLDALA